MRIKNHATFSSCHLKAYFTVQKYTELYVAVAQKRIGEKRKNLDTRLKLHLGGKKRNLHTPMWYGVMSSIFKKKVVTESFLMGILNLIVELKEITNVKSFCKEGKFIHEGWVF